MSYQLQSLLVNKNREWSLLTDNFLNKTIKTLVNNYRKVYLNLMDIDTEEKLQVDLLSLSNRGQYLDSTIGDYIVQHMPETFDTIEPALDLETSKVKKMICMDAYDLGFRVMMDQNILDRNKDIWLFGTSKLKYPLDELYHNSIFMINGQIVRSYYSPESSYIGLVDGYDIINSYDRRDQEIGVLYFGQFSDFHHKWFSSINTTVRVLKKQDNKIYIECMLDEDLTNSDVMLIVNGYLYIFDSDVYQIHENKIYMTIDKEDILRWSSSVTHGVDIWNKRANDFSDMPSITDIDIEKCLTSTSSGILVFKHDMLSIKNVLLQSVGIDNVFIHKHIPTGVLRYLDGTLTIGRKDPYSKYLNGYVIRTQSPRNQRQNIDQVADDMKIVYTPYKIIEPKDRYPLCMEIKIYAF